MQAANTGDYVVVIRDHAGDTLPSQPATLALLVTPWLSGFQSLPNGDFQFSFTGNLNKTYEIRASTNLSDWETLATVTVTANPTLWIDTNTLAVPYRFYRIRLAP